nr:hypothetical protein [Caenimonas soli]
MDPIQEKAWRASHSSREGTLDVLRNTSFMSAQLKVLVKPKKVKAQSLREPD